MAERGGERTREEAIALPARPEPEVGQAQGPLLGIGAGGARLRHLHARELHLPDGPGRTQRAGDGEGAFERPRDAGHGAHHRGHQVAHVLALERHLRLHR